MPWIWQGRGWPPRPPCRSRCREAWKSEGCPSRCRGRPLGGRRPAVAARYSWSGPSRSAVQSCDAPFWHPGAASGVPRPDLGTEGRREGSCDEAFMTTSNSDGNGTGAVRGMTGRCGDRCGKGFPAFAERSSGTSARDASGTDPSADAGAGSSRPCPLCVHRAPRRGRADRPEARFRRLSRQRSRPGPRGLGRSGWRRDRRPRSAAWPRGRPHASECWRRCIRSGGCWPRSAGAPRSGWAARAARPGVHGRKLRASMPGASHQSAAQPSRP